MKVTVDIDCTPEELRTFFGLPDVQPMQQALMKDIEDRMKTNLAAMDPDTLLKTWLPQGMQNWEQMQKVFWGQFNAGNGPAKKD
ncbi:DUF6489 family protein [Thalassospira sp.]|uniref:DUF6489 family protein n=1 Tax=Thalassospira sp. TaxID=1912094 RepID=UPI00273543E0|nr:DUF6489 family protein [Thalassospira sp.]MDP2699241.1 DUF6489 family protein [Thalassospira sp.]